VGCRHVQKSVKKKRKEQEGEKKKRGELGDKEEKEGMRAKDREELEQAGTMHCFILVKGFTEILWSIEQIYLSKHALSHLGLMFCKLRSYLLC